MSVLTNLLRCYEYCEKNDLVDVHNGNDTVLLPIYHQNIMAAKNNILKLTLDEKGALINAGFAADGEIYLFPITEDSVARSSGIAPHPLADKMQYCIKTISDKKKFEAYLEQFNDFYNYANEPSVRLFLSSIKRFLANDSNYETILSKLPFNNITKKEVGRIEYDGNKGKRIKHDFKDTFLYFEVKQNDGTYLKMNTFNQLHDEFIRYIDEKDESNEGICNISGNYEPITEKHRGLMGTAKIISVSNNKETYFGRFSEGSDIIRVGRKSSEKIHLMLKFLLENKNSRVKLADSLFLVNWFSDDIRNTISFDVTKNEVDYDSSDDFYEEVQSPVSGENRKIGTLFISGAKRLNLDEEYYVMLVDKASNGRLSVRYYKEMQNSQLINNLELWQGKYIGERKNFEKNLYYQWLPSLSEILLSAYGIERNGYLTIENESFKKDQFQNLVVALIEGRSIPSNIRNALAENIRNRQKYNRGWELVLSASLSILSEGRKEYKEMREKNSQTRSYLYGRLLAIYETLETTVLKDKEQNSKASNESGGKSNIRSTNALRYWNAFVNKPTATLKTLELATKYCEGYMLSSDRLSGFLIKIDKAKGDIIELLDTKKDRDGKANSQLDSDFIFGYYAQRKDLFTKKEKDDE